MNIIFHFCQNITLNPTQCFFKAAPHVCVCSPAYSPMAEVGECKRPTGKDPSSWGVEEVVWFIKDADPQALGPHADAFRKHEIDGDALLLLKSEMMMKYLGLKLGPALKLCYHIDRLKQNRL
uniref:SAM domain-containing protein n=1 Tax=Myripristis murdjan TaxID=586833 RepID=A0A667XGZ7_9TELE